VRYVVSPTLLSYLRATPATSTAGRGTLIRLFASTELDVSEIFGLLLSNNVDIIGIRRL
jgi:preprotein translocase subunit SecA